MARFLLLVLVAAVAAEAQNETKAEAGGEAAPPAREGKGQGAYRRLRQHLLEDHDKNVHPRLDHRHAVEVSMGMALVHLDIDEMKSTISLDVWLRLLWRNDFLTWNSSDYDGITTMHFGGHELWKPDILLYNNADVHNIELPNVHMLVYSNGEVLWVPPAHLIAFCRLDLKYWPADKQECKLKFASWTHSGEKISIGLYRNRSSVEKMNFYTNNREWHVEEMTGETGSVKYSCCEEDYPYANFIVKLQRRSPAYKSLIILPCLVLMLVTGCSFLLTPTSGEKLLVSGLALIGTLMYLVYFSTTLPFYQSSVPIIVTFYSNTAGLIGIAMLLNVMCLSMVREKKYTSPPKLLTRTFSGFLGKLLCLGNYMHQVSPTHQRLSVELSSIDNGDESCRTVPDRPTEDEGQGPFKNSIIMQDWILVAAGIERMFFIIYAIAFAVVTSIYA